jgi:transcription elongation factor GreA
MTNETYLTAEGAKHFREELENLKGPLREQLSKRLRAAIQQGDLSENADYTSAKEDQAFLEGRILELESVLKNVIIIDEMKKNGEIIGIGSKITVQEERDAPETYTLVGPEEANPINGKISFASPIGQALMNHCKGETIQIETPQGSIKLTILNVE